MTLIRADRHPAPQHVAEHPLTLDGDASTHDRPRARFDEVLVLVDVDLTLIRERRREVPLVEEARPGPVERGVRRLLEEGGDL